jgi:two-component system sensor histidine kinase YesM
VAEERLWVSVIDDGAGIEPDVLMGLLKGTRSNARSYNKVGLSNVNDRLLLFYGSASHLVVDSVPGIGTTISFSLPINGSQDSKENESF